MRKKWDQKGRGLRGDCHIYSKCISLLMKNILITVQTIYIYIKKIYFIYIYYQKQYKWKNNDNKNPQMNCSSIWLKWVLAACQTFINQKLVLRIMASLLLGNPWCADACYPAYQVSAISHLSLKEWSQTHAIILFWNGNILIKLWLTHSYLLLLIMQLICFLLYSFFMKNLKYS